MFVGGDDLDGWEIEVSIFGGAEDASTCRLEIAVYCTRDLDAVLSGLQVTLYVDDILQSGITNAGGIVEFSDIPRTALSRMTVKVQFPT